MINLNKLLLISQENMLFPVDNINTFLNHLGLVMPLINALPNVTFFVKDRRAKYLLANENLAKRCKIDTVTEVIGKSAEDIFHVDLGQSYSSQDYLVMQKKISVINKLELHLYKAGMLGWCLTTKVPIFNTRNQVIGVAGISVDLQDEKSVSQKLNNQLSKVERFISEHFDSAIKITTLANISGLSLSQLNRQFKAVFQITPQQYIQKKRLEHAIELLEENYSITEISIKCAYADHSAFCRKFKEMTTMTPSQFKRMRANIHKKNNLKMDTIYTQNNPICL
ncbi:MULTISPECIES: helix-turn-helix domain-containing protein [Providencia]|nr:MULTISPECIES: helix-turn-helix domain-containing protein [Providencia]MBP6121219.1 helix-turn-helix domain-containing protein [Providencia sp.]NIH22889.1 AraC family transcriptional regulator [Providencia heimbachae]